MSVSEIHNTIFDRLSPKVIQEFTLNCFLHHKIKLRRNWGSGDETDQLPYKDVTFLQFTTPSANLQIGIKPKENQIVIMRTSKRARKLYLYFLKILQLMESNDYKPNFPTTSSDHIREALPKIPTPNFPFPRD
jgi:hypothetical protein